MTLDEVRRINDRRLARQGQKYYAEDKVYIGNSDGSLSLIVKDVQNQYNPIAGTGISITGNYPSQTITNTLPDQTVALTAGTGISVSGTYPSFTITNTAATFGILHGTALGTDTYTSTITGVTSYADGDAYLIRFTNGNTVASPTLNINGLGAIILYRNNDGQLIGGDIVDGAEMLCVYNSTLNVFQCIGTSPNTLFAYVTNGDSVTITKGQPVYAFGGTGDRMVVKRAANTSDATSARTVGLVYSTSIGVNQKGLIITEGLLDGLNIVPPSLGWADGDIVYLGATAGTITRTKPYAPNHLVYLGVVTTASNGSAGRIQVTVQNGYELDEIHNVSAQNPTHNDIILYSSGTNLWEKTNIYSAIGAASTSTNGYLTSTDWNIFNNRLSVYSFETGLISPADNTTYYFGFLRIIPNTTATNQQFQFGRAGTIVGAIISAGINTITGSSENSTLQFRNITTSTSSSIGTFTTDGSATLVKGVTYTGLNISFAANDNCVLQWDTPAWATNPTALIIFVQLIIKH